MCAHMHVTLKQQLPGREHFPAALVGAPAGLRTSVPRYTGACPCTNCRGRGHSASHSRQDALVVMVSEPPVGLVTLLIGSCVP